MGGRPVVFLATALPEQLDACSLRPCFAAIHHLGLICDEATQAQRLRARPAWRNAGSAEFIAQACGYTRALRSLGARDDSPIALFDTTAIAPEQSAAQIASWVRNTLPQTDPAASPRTVTDRGQSGANLPASSISVDLHN